MARGTSHTDNTRPHYGPSWVRPSGPGLCAPQANFALPASAQQRVLERRSLDGLIRHAPRGEVRHHRAVRTPESGRVRVA